MSDEFRNGITENLEIVNALKNNSILKIERVSNPNTIRRFEDKKGIKKSKIFNLMPGTVLIHLDNGDVIGLDGEELKESVVVWFDHHDGINDDTVYYFRECAEFMSYDDSIYSSNDDWTHLIGEKINSIQILIVSENKKKIFVDSFQKVIILNTSKGDIVFSFCILDLPNSSSFPLARKVDIPQQLWDISEIIEL